MLGVMLAVSMVASVLSADDLPVASGARLKLEGKVAFTEGPAWHPSGNVFFSDIANNRIMRRDRTGAIHVYRTPSGRTNGLLFDLQGRLIACEGGGFDSNRRVTRTERDGTITVLADKFQGKPINSPNDVAIDSRGRLYFSDPRYRNRENMKQRDADGRLIEGVYRIDGPGKVARIITHEVDRPNGILVSPDDRYLFVSDNVNDEVKYGADRRKGHRKLWRFDLRADGTIDPASRKLLFDWGTERGPDGMAQDQKGRLYVTAGVNHTTSLLTTDKKHKAGVYVFSIEGKLLQFIAVPMDAITNCAFGDADRKTLYITAGHRLWSIRTATPGYTAWPPVKAGGK
jgi:gluconolactonase